MRLAPLLIALLVPVTAEACVIDEAPPGWRDEPVQVNPDCSYTNGGQTFNNQIDGSAAVKVGNGLIAYEVTDYNACGYFEHLVVVDCNSGQMIGIDGRPWEDGTFGGTRASLLYPPKGAIRLNSKTTIDKLVQVAERKGYTYWQDIEARLRALKKKNRPDPTCGCALFYPESAGAKQ
jgi:hypothetical protein